MIEIFDIVVDFHVHMIEYETRHPWVSDWLKNTFPNFEEMLQYFSSPQNFVSMLKEAGIDFAVVLAEYAPITTGICSNEAVEKFCQGHPSLIPFCSINPYLIAGGAQEVETLVKDRGFNGLKLYPTYNYFYPNDRMLYPIYAKCEELGIPVVFHTGSSIFRGARIKYGNPVFLDDVAVDFPDLTIVMAHSGRGFWYQEAFFLAQLHKNLYMDVTGLPVKNLLKYFPDFEKNADKILFGSDFPGLPLTIRDNMQEFLNLPVSDRTKRLVLGENAAKILKLRLT